MISKPEGYDASPAYTGESQQLPAGLYECVIKQVSMTETRDKKPQLAVLFDIASGDYAGFYNQRYEEDRQNSSGELRWRGVYKQLMEGTSLPFFKGLMTSIERSNPGFTFPWGQQGNEKALVGKKFGGVFGREEFETRNGGTAFSTKIFQVRSIEGLKVAKIPEDRLLDHRPAPSSNPAVTADGFMSVPDGIEEELPFM